MNRKGLSPLTSTMLLLAVSIMIGLIVMTWGRSYVEKTAAPSSPEKVVSPSLFSDLDQKLANGEISQDQYDKIKKVLIEQSTR